MKEVQKQTDGVVDCLKKVDRSVYPEGHALIDDTYCELMKLIYKIKDFEQIFNAFSGV